MFQEAALFPWLTARGNVDLALKLRGVPKAQRRTRVEVRLKNGRVLSAVGETRGGPDNPLTREDVTGKFAKVANRVLSREAQAPLVQLCDRLEKLDDAGQLSSLLEAPR